MSKKVKSRDSFDFQEKDCRRICTNDFLLNGLEWFLSQDFAKKMDFDAPELGLGPQLVTGEGSTGYIGMLPPKKWVKGWSLGWWGLWVHCHLIDFHQFMVTKN